MFGMGFMEIMFIAIIAIIFLGPDKLPEALVNIAKFFRSMKSTVADAKNTLEQEINISDLKQEALSYKEELMSAGNELDKATSMASITEELDDLKETISDIDKPEQKENPSPSTYAQADHETQQTPVMPEQPQDDEEETITFERKKKKPSEDA